MNCMKARHAIIDAEEDTYVTIEFAWVRVVLLAVLTRTLADRLLRPCRLCWFILAPGRLNLDLPVPIALFD